MASQVLFCTDSVFIHISVSDAPNTDTHIQGRITLLQKSDGHYLEWKASELYMLESHPAKDWALLGSVSERHKGESKSDCPNRENEAYKRYNISFDLLDLKSFKYHSASHGRRYIIFILKDGTTFPALYFHNGGSKALVKELEKLIHISRSACDPKMFMVQEHDPDMLSKSFEDLQLFTESSRQLVSNFIRDPYTTTMGSFSKVTNFLSDMLLSEDSPPECPMEEVAELLQDDIPGMEINCQEEPGFEMVNKTKLSGRPVVKRGDPLQAEQWASYFDVEGRVQCVEEIQQIIFRGGIEAAIRADVWKYLLGYYAWNATTTECQQHRKNKIEEYFRMKLQWKTISAEQERRFFVFRERKNLIEKDVTRTDRVESFFAGDQNPNVQVLFDVLMTYCMYDFDLGYVQGMSDLLSPLLLVMENEVDAFWCFAGFMDRMRHNFEMDQTGMKKQLVQIQKLVQFYDPELYLYLESHDSGNFLFCFRWLLILYKREFPLYEIQRLWEVMWTDLPCENFHLLFALAILDSEKSTLMENKFGFSEILKHINDMTNTIPLEETLNKAEGISLQMQQYCSLPSAVKEILGLAPPASSSPSSSSSPSFDSGSPTAEEPCGGGAPARAGSSAGGGSYVDGVQHRKPEDSSIVMLNEAADVALHNFFL